MLTRESIFKTNNISWYLIVRIILVYVFLVAGIQKFIFPDAMGPARFMQMGFAYPEFIAYFVASFEVICAIFIFLGLASRLAALPLIIIMSVAIVTTKIPQIGTGFWTFAHALRLDFTMLLLSIFVLRNGSDKMSLDHKIFSKQK